QRWTRRTPEPRLSRPRTSTAVGPASPRPSTYRGRSVTPAEGMTPASQGETSSLRCVRRCTTRPYYGIEVGLCSLGVGMFCAEKRLEDLYGPLIGRAGCCQLP